MRAHGTSTTTPRPGTKRAKSNIPKNSGSHEGIFLVLLRNKLRPPVPLAYLWLFI
ncbi:hypothetical protein RND71_031896 [Anisodus tanguticus]|uniref:Uncharacterized protein n=1 Tax=Anisodus tanguticus TaxID=243964 RepID=A0AAE1RC66_9SOLA|nr:hypothetical protein RND71_031896 [Anisodus tanguticus]